MKVYYSTPAITKWILFGIVAIGFFLRLFLLDRIPTAISGDELIYPFSSRLACVTGTDISGTWTIWKSVLFRHPMGDNQAELSYFLVYPFVCVFNNSLFWIRFPFAVLGTGIVLLMYLVTKKLFNSTVGLIAACMTAINPWFLFMSRTSYEMIPATILFLTALLILLSKTKYLVYCAIPALILAFYAYVGTKLVIVPFVIITVLYAVITTKRKDLYKPYTLVVLSILIMTCAFLYLQNGYPESRMGDLFLPNDPIIAKSVNGLRLLTIANPFVNIIINKPTIYLWTLAGKLFAVFSPTFLFYEGDLFFSLWHGFFYIADAVCIGIGLIMLYGRDKKRMAFLLLLIGLSVFPQLFHRTQTNFSSHITLLIPFLIMLSAYGLYACSMNRNIPVIKYCILGIVSIFYAGCVAFFLHTYFFRYPLQEKNEFHTRILSRYLKLAENAKIKTVVKTPFPDNLLKKYVFYAGLMQVSDIPAITDALKGKTASVGLISFLPCFTPKSEFSDANTIIIDSDCSEKINGPSVQIARLADAGAAYFMYYDGICGKYSLRSYPYGITWNDLAVEKLPIQKFCETYISQY